MPPENGGRVGDDSEFVLRLAFSYALFDPRGNAKVFGDIDNEDDGNDNAFRAIALFGGVLGAILSGYLSDHAIGRKPCYRFLPA